MEGSEENAPQGQEPEQTTSMAEDLAAAFDTAEQSEGEGVDDGAGNSTESQDDEQRSENEQGGERTPGGLEGSADNSDDAQGVQGHGQDAEHDTQGATKDDRAPVSLPPEAREAWKDTPQAMRDAIARREQDFARGIQQYAENARRAQQMDQALAPFQHYFMANGGNPAKTLTEVLQTATVLQSGSASQKAQVAARLIDQSGVDIGALAAALEGREYAPAKQQDAVQKAVQDAIAPYEQYMQQARQYQEQQAQQARNSVEQELEQFSSNPAHEFYNDVRADMADILDLAGRRGVDMSLQEAYDRACQLNPAVKQVIDNRVQAEALRAKSHAAGSVRGVPNGGGGGKTMGSLREYLEDAFDSASSR